MAGVSEIGLYSKVSLQLPRVKKAKLWIFYGTVKISCGHSFYYVSMSGVISRDVF